MNPRDEAKAALDKVIAKSRVHLYKPIQIAEILYHDRTVGDIDLSDLSTYRTKSKRWRDDISIDLLGRNSTSSARFQDDLFNESAMPPRLLHILGEENRRNAGAVEAYIYEAFTNKYAQMNSAFGYVNERTKENFNVREFIELFWSQPGLKRSLDKIFEIIVYALFSVLTEGLEFKVSVSINKDRFDLLEEFQDFTKNVMSVDFSNPVFTQNARVYRVGATNAADRGLDMYSNWGPVIQVKHLSLDAKLAESIVVGISSDKIVIVCKTAEKDVIVSLLTQIGWKTRIQSIITEDDLVRWYDKALTGKFSDTLGDNLMTRIRDEVAVEFPSLLGVPDTLQSRHYERVMDTYWN